jgi:hypothetical protein
MDGSPVKSPRRPPHHRRHHSGSLLVKITVFGATGAIGLSTLLARTFLPVPTTRSSPCP